MLATFMHAAAFAGAFVDVVVVVALEFCPVLWLV
jgi:hypothetical protein